MVQLQHSTACWCVKDLNDAQDGAAVPNELYHLHAQHVAAREADLTDIFCAGLDK